jgi:hypothetical protein
MLQRRMHRNERNLLPLGVLRQRTDLRRCCGLHSARGDRLWRRYVLRQRDILRIGRRVHPDGGQGLRRWNVLQQWRIVRLGGHVHPIRRDGLQQRLVLPECNVVRGRGLLSDRQPMLADLPERPIHVWRRLLLGIRNLLSRHVFGRGNALRRVYSAR